MIQMQHMINWKIDLFRKSWERSCSDWFHWLRRHLRGRSEYAILRLTWTDVEFLNWSSKTWKNVSLKSIIWGIRISILPFNMKAHSWIAMFRSDVLSTSISSLVKKNYRMVHWRHQSPPFLWFSVFYIKSKNFKHLV